jgi:hypothetical protein
MNRTTPRSEIRDAIRDASSIRVTR